MNTTKDNVILIAPELSTVSDALFELILSDVAVFVSETFYAKEGVEIIQRYMVAHCLSVLNSDSVERFQSESIDKASISRFSDEELKSTKYGAQVISLKRRFRKITGV